MIAIGQTLSGRYKILGALGAGGMGEVYRAFDQRLSREVAVKILPDRVLSDEKALSRFEKEAKKRLPRFRIRISSRFLIPERIKISLTQLRNCFVAKLFISI